MLCSLLREDYSSNLELSIFEQFTTGRRLIQRALLQMRKPTVAALPSAAAGAGLSLALACDIRIAAEQAFVSTAYVRIGLSGDYGIVWLLTRTVGAVHQHEQPNRDDSLFWLRPLSTSAINSESVSFTSSTISFSASQSPLQD